MKITDTQLQQQIGFAEAIKDELQNASFDDDKPGLQDAIAYCDNVISACSLVKEARASKKEEKPAPKAKPKKKAPVKDTPSDDGLDDLL